MQAGRLAKAARCMHIRTQAGSSTDAPVAYEQCSATCSPSPHPTPPSPRAVGDGEAQRADVVGHHAVRHVLKHSTR